MVMIDVCGTRVNDLNNWIMERPDKKEYSIEPKSPYESGLVENAYIMALEKYVDHLEQMNSSNDIQNVRDLLLDFGSYYEDDKTSIAVDEVVDNYLNQKK